MQQCDLDGDGLIDQTEFSIYFEAAAKKVFNDVDKKTPLTPQAEENAATNEEKSVKKRQVEGMMGDNAVEEESAKKQTMPELLATPSSTVVPSPSPTQVARQEAAPEDSTSAEPMFVDVDVVVFSGD